MNSKTATAFRQWATKTLRQHILKGYTIDRKRIAKDYDEFYDKSSLPTSGATKKQAAVTATELKEAIADLRRSLQDKKEASGLFAPRGKRLARPTMRATNNNGFH